MILIEVKGFLGVPLSFYISILRIIFNKPQLFIFALKISAYYE